MQAKIQKWGNSLAVRIPKALALEINIKQGELVDLSVAENKIIITPAAHEKYSLEELVKGISKENLHDEVKIGPPVGREIW